MLSIKDGVSLSGLVFPANQALLVVHRVLSNFRFPQVVVTSTREGQHMVGSLHYSGLAFDVRCNHGILDTVGASAPQVVNAVRNALAAYGASVGLAGRFDVVYEGTHLHVEYDRRINHASQSSYARK